MHGLIAGVLVVAMAAGGALTGSGGDRPRIVRGMKGFAASGPLIGDQKLIEDAVDAWVDFGNDNESDDYSAPVGTVRVLWAGERAGDRLVVLHQVETVATVVFHGDEAPKLELTGIEKPGIQGAIGIRRGLIVPPGSPSSYEIGGTGARVVARDGLIELPGRLPVTLLGAHRVVIRGGGQGAGFRFDAEPGRLRALKRALETRRGITGAALDTLAGDIAYGEEAPRRKYVRVLGSRRTPNGRRGIALSGGTRTVLYTAFAWTAADGEPAGVRIGDLYRPRRGVPRVSLTFATIQDPGKPRGPKWLVTAGDPSIVRLEIEAGPRRIRARGPVDVRVAPRVRGRIPRFKVRGYTRDGTLVRGTPVFEPR